MTKIISAFLIAVMLLLAGCDSGGFGSSKAEQLADDNLYLVLKEQLNTTPEHILGEPEVRRYAFFKDQHDIYHAAYTFNFLDADDNKMMYLVACFSFSSDVKGGGILNKSIQSSYLREFSSSDEEYIACTEKALKEKLGL